MLTKKNMNINIEELVLILKSLASEKSIKEDVVHEIIEQALAAAWRRDHGDRDQQIRASLNLHKGTAVVYSEREVVKEVEDKNLQISLAEAQTINPEAEIGQMIEKKHQVTNLGRVAAQTAKQVILQRLRETEGEMVLSEYEKRLGSLAVATITKVEPKVLRCEVGRARAIMPLSEQIPGEDYRVGARIKVLLKKIDRAGRDPQLILNRGSEDFLRLLFEKEVPEMENGAVIIKAIVREAGARSKIAVASNVPNVDPVGTLIGGRGTRIQAVNSEIGEKEKIDVVIWDKDPQQNIINALSSTEVISVTILSAATSDKFGSARVVVDKDQLSVAIGRAGHNVRLAGQLTGYEIDIVDQSSIIPKQTRHKLQRKEELEENLLKAVEETADDQDEEPAGSN